MKWNRLLKKHGWQVEQGGVDADPFALLATFDMAMAKVTFNVGTAREYGEVKVSVSVTISCPQTEAYIDLAGQACFIKAIELLNDGAQELGLAPLSTSTTTED